METKKSSKWLSNITMKLFGPQLNYKLRYFHQRKRFPNLRHPRNLSERLMSNLFSPDFLAYAQYADKVKVRDFIKSKGLGAILLDHYGVWERPEDIDWGILPDKFILKANNGCGNHVICKDKSKLDRNSAIAVLNHSIELGQNSPEPHYRAIKPKVFAEELIDTGSNSFPTDYKFTCIKGEICDIFVAVEREVSTKYITLDLEWNVLPYTKVEYMPKNIPEKPNHLSDMVEVARKLSADFEFVRVDLYEYHDKVYFSELTFSPWGTLMYSYTDEALEILGKKFEKED